MVIGLAMMACDGTGGTDGVLKTDELYNTIKTADNAKYGVRVATAASEVFTEYFWVTQTVMDTFNDAIGTAQAVYDDPVSQGSVDAAMQTLKNAITVFENAKQAGTDTNFITLSGTVQVTHNGQAVPYVAVTAYTGDWSWDEIDRIPSGETTWKIAVAPFSTATDVYFRVCGYQTNAYDSGDALFKITVDSVTVKVSNQSISNIALNVGNINTITLSGTLNISNISAVYNSGDTIPSVQIQAWDESGNFFGETTVFSAGSNSPWSINIQALSTPRDLHFAVYGFSTRDIHQNNTLFTVLDVPDVTGAQAISNQNRSGIIINIDLAPDQQTNWSSWVSSDSTATLTYSVGNDDVVTVVVGGSASSEVWHASVRYSYTAEAGVTYAYTFEAWTDGADRELNVQWYENNDDEVWQTGSRTITSERKTYTVAGDEAWWAGTSIPKSGEQGVHFRCADQLGTFYVKMLSIEVKLPTVETYTTTAFDTNNRLWLYYYGEVYQSYDWYNYLYAEISNDNYNYNTVSYAWYIDGVLQTGYTDYEIEIPASEFSPGIHYGLVVVTIDEIAFSREFSFRVYE